VPPASPPPPPRPPRKFPWWIIAAVALVIGLIVIGGIAFVVTRPGASPSPSPTPSPELLPDLVVRVRAEREATTVVIVNAGAAAAGAFDVQFITLDRFGRRSEQTQRISGLAPGESRTFPFFGDIFGAPDAAATADTGNEVRESDERNNRAGTGSLAWTGPIDEGAMAVADPPHMALILGVKAGE